MHIRKKHIDNKTSYGPNKYYLYVKIHSKTGLKYLGRTSQNPTTYLGSGKHWERHLKKHGKEHVTIVIGIYPNLETLSKAGLYYSRFWDVVKSKKWANLCEEDGNNETKGWRHLTPEMRTANGKKGGAKGGAIMGPRTRDQKIRLFGRSEEKRKSDSSRAGKISTAKRVSNPEYDLKYRKERREWMLVNNPYRGKKHTDEIKSVIKSKLAGIHWMNNGIENQRIIATDQEFWLSKGYKIGRLMPKGYRVWITDGKVNKKVFKTELQDWLNKGHTIGRTVFWVRKDSKKKL